MIRQIRNAAVAAATASLLSGCQLFMPPPDLGEDTLKTVLFDAADSSREMHNYQAALTYYRTLYRRDPSDVRALLGYARNLRFTGNAPQAVALLRVGVQRMPGEPEVLTELGKAQLAAGLPDEALVALNLAEKRGSRDWRLFSARGIALDMLGQFEAAQADYGTALEIEPRQVSVLNNLALSWALSGRIDTGVAILEQLARVPTAAPQTRQNLALLYAMTGDAKRAADLAKRDLSPADAAENAAVYRQLAAATAGAGAARE